MGTLFCGPAFQALDGSVTIPVTAPLSASSGSSGNLRTYSPSMKKTLVPAGEPSLRRNQSEPIVPVGTNTEPSEHRLRSTAASIHDASENTKDFVTRLIDGRIQEVVQHFNEWNDA